MFRRIIIRAFICIIAVLLLCSCGNDAVQNSENNNTSTCSHDENYVEPAVICGKYYLNGDINSYYFDVSENTVELCGVDLSSLYDSWQPYNNDETADEELKNKRSEAKEKWITEWSAPRYYTVKTLHDTTDKTTLVLQEVVSPEGFVLSSGLTLKDEKTITDFGNAGDFIFVG